MLKRRDYTREILRQMKAGRVPVRSFGSPEPVRYEPRLPSDPRPWTTLGFRYSGREVHTIDACGRDMVFRARIVRCEKAAGHGQVCSPLGHQDPS